MDNTTREEGTAYHATRLSPQLASPEKVNQIDALSEEQGITLSLVYDISAKLRTVSDAEPEKTSKSFDMPPHIANNVSRQRDINSALRGILRSLVI